MSSVAPSLRESRRLRPDEPLMVGWTYETWFPFKRTTYTQFDNDGGYTVDTWAPGWEVELLDEHDNTRHKWDGDGAMLLTVVSLHKPGPAYPERAFYTRQWRDPTGHVFGRNGLRVVTARALRAWLGGSKVKHLFEDRQAALESSAALFTEALAFGVSARDGATQKDSALQAQGDGNG